MTAIHSMPPIPAPGAVRPGPGEGRAPADRAAGSGFGEALEAALREVDHELTAADRAAEDYLSGRGGDLHNVLMQVQKADLTYKTMIQVRNKVLEAYREVMRMPV